MIVLGQHGMCLPAFQQGQWQTHAMRQVPMYALAAVAIQHSVPTCLISCLPRVAAAFVLIVLCFELAAEAMRCPIGPACSAALNRILHTSHPLFVWSIGAEAQLMAAGFGSLTPVMLWCNKECGTGYLEARLGR